MFVYLVYFILFILFFAVVVCSILKCVSNISITEWDETSLNIIQ